MARVDKISWWQWLPIPRRKWRIVARTEGADLVPERLPRLGVALAGPPARPNWAVFDCPCGHGHRLMLNLDSARHPVWRVLSSKPLSLRPSIDDLTAERRCHFWIRDGRTVWVHNDRRT
jgi:hypothetical protein